MNIHVVHKKCSKCKKRVASKNNSLCNRCNQQRMKDYRNSAPLPLTEEGRGIRATVDSTFDFLEANPGSTATVEGITITEQGDKVEFDLTPEQQQILTAFAKRKDVQEIVKGEETA